MGQFMFKQYQKKEIVTENPNSTIPTVVTEEILSFLQIGVYSNMDSMKKNLSKLESYIYEEKDGKYYVYIGIIKNSSNLEKIKGIYKNMGYDIYVKEFGVKNSDFIEELNKYEQLISGTSDEKTIKTAVTEIINKYKELVVNDKN